MIEECYDAVLDEQDKSSASSDETLGKRARVASPVKKAKKAKATTSTGEKTTTKKEKTKKKPRKVTNPENNAFTRTWVLSDELAAVTGSSAVSVFKAGMKRR